jgi:hypothetical protein
MASNKGFRYVCPPKVATILGLVEIGTLLSISDGSNETKGPTKRVRFLTVGFCVKFFKQTV